MWSSYFSCAEDYPFSTLFCGWSIGAQALLDAGRLEDIASQLYDERGRMLGVLEWQIGAHELGDLDGDEQIVLGLHVGFPEDGLTFEQLQDYIKRAKAAVKKLGDALSPFDTKAAPSFYAIAQGPLCNAVLVRGVRMGRELVFNEDGDYRDDGPYGKVNGPHAFDWHRISQGQNQDEPAELIFGVRLGQAGPWRGPMTSRIDLSKPLETALEKACKARQLEGARYHMIYQYSN